MKQTYSTISPISFLYLLSKDLNDFTVSNLKNSLQVAMSRMDVDDDAYVPHNTNNANYDSMSEEEEYQPIDYNTYKRKPKKTAHKRAQRSFVVGDQEEIEYQRPVKKRKKVPLKSTQKQINPSSEPDSLNNGITSTNIINSLKKKNQNYDKRATTKILSAKEKNEKNGINIKARATKGKTKRKRKTKNGIDSFSTTLLIAQKTTQNSMHANVPLTIQEKYLKSQYRAIDDLLEKQKKVCLSQGARIHEIRQIQQNFAFVPNVFLRKQKRRQFQMEHPYWTKR